MSERIRVHRKPQTKSDKQRARAMRRVWREAEPEAKVRCLTDLSDLGYFLKIHVPLQGEVYTIRELRRGLWDMWSVGFTLVEIRNEVSPVMGSEPFFCADWFEIVPQRLKIERKQPQLRLVVSREITAEAQSSADSFERIPR